MKERATFSGRIGFVLAAAGSAVGLGNLWRFPYLAAQYGGRTFLIVYIILSVTFGFTLMITEIAIGRKTGQSAIGAYKELNKKWWFIGPLSVIIPVIVLSFYCVLGGWVAKFGIAFITGNGTNAAQDGYFDAFISGNVQPFVLGGAFLVLTVLTVMLGVKKGIERVSKILMPILILLLLAVAIYIMTMPGAMEGVIYYIRPHYEDFSFQAVMAAMGQVFFSMSLAQGVIITFGSYMKKDENIEKASRQIELFDIGIALLAGLLVVPAVFVVSGDPHAVGVGPELMFVTMPKVFETMGAVGGVIGGMFFVLVFFAAVTSSIGLLEVPISALNERFGLSRTKAGLIMGVIVAVLASMCVLGYGAWSGFSYNGMNVLELFDYVSSNILMPLVAILMCVLIGHVMGTGVITEEITLSGEFKHERMHRVMIRYIVPIMVAGIMITGILENHGIIKM